MSIRISGTLETTDGKMSAQRHELNLPVENATEQRARLVELAHAQLMSYPHLRRYHAAIDVDWVDQRLQLTGSLPTYFLKQLAQEALRGFSVPLSNQINVTDASKQVSKAPPIDSTQSPLRKPK